MGKTTTTTVEGSTRPKKNPATVKKPAAKPVKKPAAKPVKKPAAKPVKKPAAKPVKKPAAKTVKSGPDWSRLTKQFIEDILFVHEPACFVASVVLCSIVHSMLQKNDLERICQKCNLPKGGNKTELEKRLKQAWKKIDFNGLKGFLHKDIMKPHILGKDGFAFLDELLAKFIKVMKESRYAYELKSSTLATICKEAKIPCSGKNAAEMRTLIMKQYNSDHH